MNEARDAAVKFLRHWTVGRVKTILKGRGRQQCNRRRYNQRVK